MNISLRDAIQSCYNSFGSLANMNSYDLSVETLMEHLVRQDSLGELLESQEHSWLRYHNAFAILNDSSVLPPKRCKFGDLSYEEAMSFSCKKGIEIEDGTDLSFRIVLTLWERKRQKSEVFSLNQSELSSVLQAAIGWDEYEMQATFIELETESPKCVDSFISSYSLDPNNYLDAHSDSDLFIIPMRVTNTCDIDASERIEIMDDISLKKGNDHHKSDEFRLLGIHDDVINLRSQIYDLKNEELVKSMQYELPIFLHKGKFVDQKEQVVSLHTLSLKSIACNDEIERSNQRALSIANQSYRPSK